MADWKVRGYVPDSDEEDEELGTSVTGQVLSINAGNHNNRFYAEQAIRNSHAQQQLQGESVSGFASTLPNSTAKQLEQSLSQGLQDVREVLAWTRKDASNAIDDDDSPLSSLPSSAANSPRIAGANITATELATTDLGFLNVPTEGSAQHVRKISHHRSLRTRNPIQLHPYMLEDAKYRTLMQARGLKPVHLPRQAVETVGATSGEDSQESNAFFSSQLETPQPVDLQYLSAVQTDQGEEESQSPILGNRRLVHKDDEGGEELPDITQILRHTHSDAKRVYKPRFSRSQKKQRKQDDRSFDVHLHDQSLGIAEQESALPHRPSAFHIPPSPSHSSNDDTTDDGHVGGLNGTTGSSNNSHGLPTPLVSSEMGNRKRTRMTLSSSESVSSAEDTDESLSSSLQNTKRDMKHMGRRIRGVLPASWLKLDMKSQAKAKTKLKLNQSPSKDGDTKGVARRIALSRNTINDNYPGQQLNIFEPESDSDAVADDADQPRVLVESYESVINLTTSTDVFGEAQEDNYIDAMLPSKVRKPTKSSRKHQSQRRIDENWRPSSQRTRTTNNNWPEDIQVRGGSRKQTLLQRPQRQKKPKPRHELPRMSVLDAPSLFNLDKSAQPKFLRLAARQARHKQYATEAGVNAKIFRLADSEDTRDINHEITKWKQRQKVPMHNSSVSNPVVAEHAQNRPFPTKDAVASASIRQTISNIQALKHNTHLLLERVSAKGQENGHVNHNEIPGTSSNTEALQQQYAMPSTQLQFLFPHRNRSGKGRLISNLDNPRPAQVEAELPTTLLRPPPIPRKFPKNFASISQNVAQLREYALTKAELSNKEIRNFEAHSQSRQGLARRLRKQKPQKAKTLRNSTPPSKSASPNSLTETASQLEQILPHGDACTLEDLWSDTRADSYLSAVVNRVQSYVAVLGYTNISAIEVPSSLADAVLRANTDHVYEMNTRHPETQLCIHGVDDRKVTVGLYNAHAQKALSEYHQAILSALKTWDYASSGPLEMFKDVIAYVERSLCFPVLDPHQMPNHFEESGAETSSHARDFSSMERSLFIRESLDFIDNVMVLLKPIEAKLPRSAYKLAVKLLNEVTIHSFQIYNVAKPMSNLVQRTKECCTKAIQHTLSNCLGFENLRKHLLPKLREIHSNDTIFGSSARLMDLPEAQAVVICWHLSAVISKQNGGQAFYQTLARSADESPNSNAILELDAMLAAICYCVHFTKLDTNGKIGNTAQEQASDTSGWPVVMPLILKLVNSFRKRSPSTTTRHYRDLMKKVVYFVLCLASEWQWRPSPNLVKSLLEIYSSNDMLPFDFRGDVHGIFYDHSNIDTVPEHQKNDYDRFLDLVKITIDMQLTPIQDEMGDRATTTAKELRGLVYSLIPNNAQLHDAREELQAEHFLGLKNHFALYLALYRNAPDGCRPRIQQLEQQVDIELSHLMVCKLALKAWEVIACHEVRQTISSSAVLGDIGDWSQNILDQLAKRLALGQPDGLDLYAVYFKALGRCLDACFAEETARSLLSPVFDYVRTLMRSNNFYDGAMVAAVFSALESYVKKTPACADSTFLTGSILPIVRNAVQHILHNLESSIEVIKSASSIWFSTAASLVRSSQKAWFDFMEPHSALSIDQLSGSENETACDIAKSLFLADLIEIEKDSIFLEHRPQIFSNWITLLLLPFNHSDIVTRLTECIFKYGGESLQINTLAQTNVARIDSLADVRLPILQHLVRNIYSQQGDPESEWLAGGLEENDLIQLLKTMADSMKRYWKTLRSDPTAQNSYTILVQAVVNEMEIYPFRGFRLDSWFIDGKEFPRPSQTFDNMFKCRFGAEGGEIAKSTIVTFRMKCIEAVRFDKTKTLSRELGRVFSCTDRTRIRYTESCVPEYSVDLIKQTRFIRLIAPTYLEQASLEKGAQVTLPLIECLQTTTSGIFFRVDNVDYQRMRAFIDASFACLAAIQTALDMESQATSATSALLRYAKTALETIRGLFQELEEVNEIDRKRFASTLFGFVMIAFAHLTTSETEQLQVLALRFSSWYQIDNLQPMQLSSPADKTLQDFARRDLQEGLQAMGEVQRVTCDLQEVRRAARAILNFFSSLQLMSDSDDEDENKDLTW